MSVRWGTVHSLQTVPTFPEHITAHVKKGIDRRRPSPVKV